MTGAEDIPAQRIGEEYIREEEGALYKGPMTEENKDQENYVNLKVKSQVELERDEMG